MAVIEEGCEMRKEEESKEVSVIAASTTKGKGMERSVAIFKADFKDRRGK